MANKKKQQQKKKQQAKAAAAAAATENGAASSDHEETMPIDTPEPQTPQTEFHEPAASTSQSPLDPKKQAEKEKEQGNVAFKAGKFYDAVEKYTRAIELDSGEPTYLTNRAAAYMALKKFRPALADCQQAANLQSAAPSVKTLVRLARCQLSTGSTAPALSTLRAALALEPRNDAALQLQKKVEALEKHLRNHESSRAKKDWAMARLSLDRCIQAIEAEGGDTPIQWRLWKVEMEISRGNWDTAGIAANDAMREEPNSPDVLTLRGLLMFLTAKTAQALQHVQSALRLDPGHEPAMRLRKRVKDVDRLKDEGNSAFKAGKLEEAIARYSESLERIGESDEEGKGGYIRAMLLSNRATTYLKMGKDEEAIQDADTSIELNPATFKVYRTRARARLHLEMYQEAVNDFKAAIEHAESEGSDADVRALRTELKKAELDLKRSKTKDYYKILGVAKDSTETEIKKAYRRESLKHHPDKGGDEEKFKLVSEAHSVLSDPHKRSRYDMGDDDEEMGFNGMGGGMNPMDFADIFTHFQGGGFSGFGGGFHSHGGGGRSSYGFAA
ncbi:hypothetical protein EIP86_000726 [Pleurotus ostreatoroseus]|nr:hypothetical protein EIP86_000726 [Pleurotus ostreatoroseus]